jgi:tRNA pseudouridine38/39 synthase
MVSNESQTPIHPVLQDLGLLPQKKSKKVSSFEVLSYLLEHRILGEESVRSAVQALSRHPNTEAKTQASTTNNDAKHITPPTTKQKDYRTRHIALRFLYDGANFSGLAQNIGQDSDNSVERALFQALMRARLVESRETSGYSRCGRTDRGVSAAGQVVALQLKSAIPLDASLDPEGTQLLLGENDNNDNSLPKNEQEIVSAWVVPRKRNNNNDGGNTTTPQRVEKELSEYPYAKILNNLLPPEIRILGWAPVSQEFSARFSATTRTYRYFFVRRRLLDLQRMQAGLSLLVGKHDFRNFCKMDVEKVYNFERVIHDAKIFVQKEGSNDYIAIEEYPQQEESSSSHQQQQSTMCYVQIHGQAFLWHQIRCIMEVLFMIGNRLEDPSIVTQLFNVEKYPGKPAYPLAPEKPLVLTECGYPNLQMGYSVQNIWSVSCQLEQQWEELVLAAARIRNGINVFRKVSIRKDELLQFATAKMTERNRKLQKSGVISSSTSSTVNEAELSQTLSTTSNNDATKTTLCWSDALKWLLENCQLIPDSKGLDTSIHIPLLKRSRGTTYEEKVAAIQKSEKRRQKYEDNVIKKRKTAEEDAAFYNHMAQQGGTGM